MQFDAWKLWFPRTSLPARRTVLVRQPRSVQLEVLEDRFLLGELTPSGMPGLGDSAPAEVTTSALVTSSTGQTATQVFSQQELKQDAKQLKAAAKAERKAGNTGSVESVAPLAAADSARSTAMPSSVASDLKQDKLAAKTAKAAAKAELKAEKKAAKEQKKADKANSKNPTTDPTDSGTAEVPGTETGGGTNGTPNPNGSQGNPTDGSGSTGNTNGSGATPGTGSSGPGTTPTGPGGSGVIAPAFPGDPQLNTAEVEQFLDRASAATPSQDAIIVIVDRQGYILGVRTETAVQTADLAELVFSIDGAVAKARTAAFFSNDQAPLTSRTVRFISQTTITEREVDSNPSIADMTSTTAGPGFVAPIGLGGHFPPNIAYTPPVDLFAIEHTNRDSIDAFASGNGRFNAEYVSADQEIYAPKSYGVQSGLMPDALPRGIATLPGGIPIYRDTDANGVGDTLIGGIGVFFPGPDGYASYEQGFVHGDGKTATKRTNASRVLEAEFMALAAIGSSVKAGVVAGPVGGVAPVTAVDLPFGRIDLVGITLEAVGPTAGIEGVKQLLKFGADLGGGVVNGVNHMVTPADLFLEGVPVPSGWLVAPKGSGSLTASDVMQIINQGIAEAMRVRAAIRLPLGQRTRMVFAVTDLNGEVLGLFRMDDATYFSLDVAVAKARNVSYYADPTALDPADQVLSKNNIAFTSRTFRFLAEPRYPAGVEGSRPGPFSILNEPSINPTNAENLGAPAPANAFNTVVGYDAFNIGANFRDTTSPSENQNGVVFFPGSMPLYKNGVLVGGLGVSGDGVDQDDVVTYAAARGFMPPTNLRADQYTFRGVRLPITKFLRNPYG